MIPAVAAESPSAPERPARPGAQTAALSLLGWTLAVPFFLLPGPLTIEAPDIYGGFDLHLRLGALMALGGLALGAAHLWLVPRESERPAIDRTLAVVLLLGLAGLLLFAAGGTIGPAFLGSGRTTGLPDHPVPVALATAALLLRAGLDRRKGGAARLLASGGLLWLALVSLQVLTSRDRLPAWSGWVLVAVCAALVVAWPLLARPGRRWRIGWIVAGAASYAVAGLHTGRTETFSQGSGGWPWGITAGIVLAAVGVQLQLRAGRVRKDGPAWRLPWQALATGLLLLLALASGDGLLDRSTSLAESWAFVLEPVRGALYTDAAPRGLPSWASRLWLLAWTAGALQATTATAVRRWLGGTAVLWTLLVIVQAAGLGGGPTWPLLLALAAIPLALLWPWLLTTGRFDPGWGALAGGALIGPIALRYLLAAVMLRPPGGAVLVGTGVVLGAAVALPLALGRSDVPVGAGARTAGLLVAGVVGVMPVYAAVSLGLFPGLTLGMALGCVAGVGLGWRRARRPALLAPLIALWLFWYGCTAAMTVFKAGPSADDCAEVLASSPARVLLDRFEEGGEYVAAQPYDVLPLPRHGVLLASFKRIEHAPGFVELLELDRPGVRSRLVTERPGPYPSWPERMEHDPVRDGVITQILGREDYALWDLHVAEPSPGEHRLWMAFDLPLDWEPGNPALDIERRRMTITFVPNRQAKNPLAWVYDLDTLRPISTLTRPGGRLEMADFAAIDLDSGRSWIPAWYDTSRFALVGFDAGGTVHRQTETAAPGVGLVVEGSRLYVTRSLAGGLAVHDVDGLEILQILPAGRFPWDLVLDRERHRLYVGGYADGIVRAWSTGGDRLVPLFEVEVGSLLRGLGLDPVSGRVYAASGCGLFEVAGEDGAPPAAR